MAAHQAPVPGTLQARILEWAAISFSSAWKWKVKVKSLSRVWLFATPWTVAYQTPPSLGFSRQEYWSGVPLLSYLFLHLLFRSTYSYFPFSFALTYFQSCFHKVTQTKWLKITQIWCPTVLEARIQNQMWAGPYSPEVPEKDLSPSF